MPLVKLKSISQGTWLNTGGGPEATGLCYSMCNFIESDKGIWSKPGSFANAVTAAQNFAQGTVMMNYAKAQTLRKSPYAIYPGGMGGALTTNRIYRAQLWVGPIATPPGAINHEILIVTGNNNDIAYFDPNTGFFQASNAGMNNAQAIEFFINQQYGPISHVGNFAYLNVRSNTAATPLGFTV